MKDVLKTLLVLTATFAVAYYAGRASRPAEYWPTIEEMQTFAGAEIDGIWGPETDRLYRQAQERWYCDNAYTELIERQK